MSNWNVQANEIFLQLVDLATTADQQACLVQTCGTDAELRSEVERLLQAHQAAGDFLEHPVAVLQDPPLSEIDERPGALVGPYRLIDQIGEGGFGVVFRARQERPIVRTVAVKILKPGMDTRQVIARFETERQVLALLDHPQIARLLDAGATAAGRPYFVMEYVDGVSITEWCDKHELSIRERLALFISVCSAVQHAHQRGIIHRDLKPSNVLVTGNDGQPRVKVIDFGIAKATLHQAEGFTSLTGAAQWIGTPLYMSPEQAERGHLEVDTRSDVYSLGALLYELLTGAPPFAEEKQAGARFEELRKIICTMDPPVPSVKSREQTAGRTSRGQDRSRDIPRDLDWVVMKALEKDRNRRYESPGALAADIRNFLQGDPVQASPPSATYRLSKFVRRHRGSLVVASAMLLALVAGTTLATWQALEATRARRLADERLVHSQRLLQREAAALLESRRQSDRARQSAEQTRRLLYAGDMRLACYAWQGNDVRRMRELLDRHIPTGDQKDLRGFEWHLLANHSEVSSRQVFLSDKPLYFVTFSPDGRWMAAAGADGQIRLFDGQSFQLLREFASDQSEVNGLSFSTDSMRLASAGDDGSIVIRDVPAGQELRRIKAHPDIAFQVLFVGHANRVVSCGRDPVVRLWDADSGAAVGELTGHTGVVEAMALSPNGTVLATVDHEGLGIQWNLAERTRIPADLHAYPLHPYSCVAWSPSGQLVAAGRKNGMLTVFQSSAGALTTLQRFTDGIQSLAFAPAVVGTQGWLAVGCRDGSVSLQPMNDSADATGPISDGRPGSRGRQWQGHASRVYSVAFAPGRPTLLTAGEDGRLMAWEWQTSEASRVIHEEVQDFVFHGESEIISSSTEFATDRRVRVHSLTTGVHLRTFSESSNQWSSLAYAVETGQLFALEGNRRIVSSAMDDSEPKCVWTAPPDFGVSDLSVSPDGRKLALEYYRNEDVFLVLLRGELTSRLSCHVIHEHEHSPDGKVVVYDLEKEILVVDAESGESVGVLSGHATTITGLKFSPDSRYLASASNDRTVRVWDWRAGREIWKELAHSSQNLRVAFSPDGETLATAGDDRMLRLWRWKQGTLVLEYPLAGAGPAKLAFSQDGMKIVCLDTAHVLRVYDAAPRAK